MTFREIRHDSGDYHREVKLRFDVLRRQLAPGAADDDYAAEAGFIHFGLFDGDEIVACCFVVPMSGDTVRLRQMAVHPDRQRLGLGRRLIREVETELARRGCHCIVLHAREGARGFYERTGYAVTSDAFTEVGIPHFRMEKPLP
jgi:predicted GNAT family N-acyltransferase